jgi:hypothetical protein
VIQIVAKLRRVAALTAALASLSVLSPATSDAQAPPPPPADTTAKPVDTSAQPAAADTTAKPAAAPAPAAGVQGAPASPAPTSTATGKSGKTAKPPKTSKPKAPKAAAAGAAAGAAAKQPDPAYLERRKVDGVYAKGSSWLGLRFGYANRTGDLSGDGYVGYGISWTRMLAKQYAFAAGIDHDIVGHFASQTDISVPFTGEFQRVFKGKEMRPYVGVGGGFYFRKFYRTAHEYNTTTTGGAHVSVGLTSQLDDKHVVGFETRVAWLQGRPGVVNPTFGAGEDTETIWTAKLSWALSY